MTRHGGGIVVLASPSSRARVAPKYRSGEAGGRRINLTELKSISTSEIQCRSSAFSGSILRRMLLKYL